MRRGYEQPVPYRNKETGSCSHRRVDVTGSGKLVLVRDVKDVDVTFSSDDVKVLPISVVEEIVRISHGGRSRDDAAGIRIDDEQQCRNAAGKKQTMMFFIEGHGKVRECRKVLPLGAHFLLAPVDNRDAPVAGKIDEQPLSIRGELKRFRMHRKLHRALDGEVQIECRDSSASIAHQDQFAFSVKAKIVGVVSECHCL